MNGRQYRVKMQPYRLLASLVWFDYGWAKWEGDTVSVIPGNLARLFRISRDRVWSYIEFLQKYGFVSNARQEGTRYVFTVNKPTRWSIQNKTISV